MSAKKNSGVLSLLPFWCFVLFFKFGAGLHYTLLSTLGIQVLPAWVVGLGVGGAALLQLILDVPAGYLLDRFGYVRLLRWATFAFMLGAVVLCLGLTKTTFALTLLFSTIGWLFFGPGTSAYVLAKAPREVAGKYLGFFHAVASAGIVLATVCLTLIIRWPPQAIGAILAGLLLCALVAAWLTPRSLQSVHAEKKVARHGYYVRRRFITQLFASIRKLNPASTMLLLQNFTSSLFYGAIWFAVPLVLARGVRTGMIGISLSVFDLSIVVLGTYLGKLADRHDQKRLVFYGLLLFAVAGTLLGFNLNLWFLLLGFLATAGDEMSSVSLWAWLDRLDETHDQDGLINGAIALFDDLGWTIGPIAAGFLFGAVGPALTITLCAIPIFALWILSAVFMLKPSVAANPARHGIFEAPRRLRHKR